MELLVKSNECFNLKVTEASAVLTYKYEQSSIIVIPGRSSCTHGSRKKLQTGKRKYKKKINSKYIYTNNGVFLKS